jgi:hypothetical protein
MGDACGVRRSDMLEMQRAAYLTARLFAAAAITEKCILLASDGANTGSADDLKSAVAAAAKVARVSTLGIGRGHDSKALTNIARAGGGVYMGISDIEQISDAVSSVLAAAQSRLARNVELTIEVNGAAEVERVISPYPYSHVLTAMGAAGGAGRDSVAPVPLPVITVNLGDISADAHCRIIVNLRLPAGVASTFDLTRLLRTKVTYTPARLGPAAAQATIVAPPLMLPRGVDGTFTPGFAERAFTIRAATALFEALTMPEKEAQAHLRECQTELAAWVPWYGASLPSAHRDRVQDDIAAAIQDCERGDGSDFRGIAMSMNTPGLLVSLSSVGAAAPKQRFACGKAAQYTGRKSESGKVHHGSPMTGKRKR